MRHLAFVSVRFLLGFFCMVNAAEAWSSLHFTDISFLLAQLIFHPEIVIIISFGLLFGMLFLAHTWTKLANGVMNRIKNGQPLDRYVMLESLCLTVLFVYFSYDQLPFMMSAFLFTLVYGLSSSRKESQAEHIYANEKVKNE